MPRRYTPTHRPVVPDARYNNTTVSMFINRMMHGGKKSTARAVMYEAMAMVEDRTKKDALEVFETALRNVAPAVESKAKRVGGPDLQVPMEGRSRGGNSLAVRWNPGAARGRSGPSMAEKLASEFMDAFHGTGTAFKKRDETHKM